MSKEEDELLTYAREHVQHFTTQADFVAEMVGFAIYAGHTQLMAERYARYVWDTTEHGKAPAVDDRLIRA